MASREPGRKRILEVTKEERDRRRRSTSALSDGDSPAHDTPHSEESASRLPQVQMATAELPAIMMAAATTPEAAAEAEAMEQSSCGAVEKAADDGGGAPRGTQPEAAAAVGLGETGAAAAMAAAAEAGHGSTATGVGVEDAAGGGGALLQEATVEAAAAIEAVGAAPLVHSGSSSAVGEARGEQLSGGLLS